MWLGSCEQVTQPHHGHHCDDKDFGCLCLLGSQLCSPEDFTNDTGLCPIRVGVGLGIAESITHFHSIPLAQSIHTNVVRFGHVKALHPIDVTDDHKAVPTLSMMHEQIAKSCTQQKKN